MEKAIKEVEEPRKEIERQVEANYGRYSYIQDIDDSEEGVYTVKVGFRLPRTFNDKKLGKVYYHHLELEDVVTVTADYNSELSKELRIEMPEPSEVSDRIDDSIESIKRSIEKRLASVVGKKLADIPSVRNDFARVRRLLRLLREKNELYFDEVDAEEFQKYIDLLVSMSYIEEGDGFYTESGKLKQLYEDEGENAFNAVVEDILTNKMHHLKEFNLTNVLPYIRILETYYFVAMNTKDDIELTISQIRRNHDKLHGKRTSEGKIIDRLYDLDEAGIFERNEEFYKGDEQITNKIVGSSTVAA